MSEEKEYTGGSVSYYSIDVNDPINENSDPYTAECQDIIEALKLDFQEGNVLKAIWRRAAARLGRSKKGYDDGLYDAEKIVFYGQRLVAAERRSAFDKTPEWPLADVMPITPEQDPYGPRDAEGWYAWSGDETMRPAGDVQVVLRDGTVNDGRYPAEKYAWRHGNFASDIVKWRPAQ
ncbi:MAG: hypothetical protein [Caudoviricetes sp.]|nr:MAG: hypothetical protein [Caudoviricetes sp.]